MTGRYPVAPNSGTSQVGPYLLDHVLGLGSMGVVYKGRESKTGRPVAIKLIRKDLLEGQDPTQILKDFDNEAAAVLRLRHPNIVAALDFGEHEGMNYLVMEYVRGRSLRELMRGGREFTSFEAVAILLQVLSALEHVHERGIVHRDVTPANILIDEIGHARLMDFGIAKLDTAESTLTAMTVGTPAYMSPEQCMGGDVDRRADLFSAGAVLYHLLTGLKPFDAASPMTTIHKVLKQAHVMPSKANAKVPRAFDSLINRALAKKPKDRYQTAREFIRDLQAVAQKMHQRQPTFRELMARWLGSRWKAYAAAIAVAIALGLGALGVYWPMHQGVSISWEQAGPAEDALINSLAPKPAPGSVPERVQSQNSAEISRHGTAWSVTIP